MTFSTGFIPDYIDYKYFAGKPVVTINFGLCFAAKENFYWHIFPFGDWKKFWSPVGASRKKLISDPAHAYKIKHDDFKQTFLSLKR